MHLNIKLIRIRGHVSASIPFPDDLVIVGSIRLAEKPRREAERND